MTTHNHEARIAGKSGAEAFFAILGLITIIAICIVGGLQVLALVLASACFNLLSLMFKREANEGCCK